MSWKTKSNKNQSLRKPTMVITHWQACRLWNNRVLVWPSMLQDFRRSAARQASQTFIPSADPYLGHEQDVGQKKQP